MREDLPADLGSRDYPCVIPGPDGIAPLQACKMFFKFATDFLVEMGVRDEDFDLRRSSRRFRRPHRPVAVTEFLCRIGRHGSLCFQPFLDLAYSGGRAELAPLRCGAISAGVSARAGGLGRVMSRKTVFTSC